MKFIITVIWSSFFVNCFKIQQWFSYTCAFKRIIVRFIEKPDELFTLGWFNSILWTINTLCELPIDLYNLRVLWRMRDHYDVKICIVIFFDYSMRFRKAIHYLLWSFSEVLPRIGINRLQNRRWSCSQSLKRSCTLLTL